ncbi:hypothetical protein [Gemmatimonas sp.]|jgi:hypothetical protein|uniref:hypothetical protein n=1 Tax=Gemmatimonas sp. TaxID=1962908 RepID=UPI0037C120C3
MPLVNFETLPNEARAWVFAAAAPVTGAAATALLTMVDAHLHAWRAHGAPLVCAREWRDDRFLVVAVDEAATGASGCSIDALFHALRAIEGQVGSSLVASGQLYWRDASGVVQVSDRPSFRALATAGNVGGETHVFDTTVTSVGAWRAGFVRKAADSWHARFLS